MIIQTYYLGVNSNGKLAWGYVDQMFYWLCKIFIILFLMENFRTKSTSLFLKENSNIILITNDTSDHAGFYEMNIFDNVYVEQLANSGLHNYS